MDPSHQTRLRIVVAASTAIVVASIAAVTAGASSINPVESASGWGGSRDILINDVDQVDAVRLGGHGDIHSQNRRTGGTTRNIVHVDSLETLDDVTASLEGNVRQRYSSGFYAFSANLTAGDIHTLNDHPGVMTVEHEKDLRVAATQNNPPWGLDRIDQRTRDLDNKYTYTSTGAGVDMYILDSGLWFSHNEFTGRITDAAYWDFGDEFEAWDCTGHGTHVTGTAGGTTYGVAKHVNLIPVRILNCSGSGPLEAVLAGISWVIDHHHAGIPAVATMSIGGLASSTLDAAVNALIADGVTVVVAAGNDALPTCNYSPARVPAAITVAASDIDDQSAVFSNYGVCNDLFAPGVGILSAAPSLNDSGSAVASGTSMAAPHVAGAAALILQRSPGATPAQVWSTMDAANTKGVLDICCGDPNKLLFTGSTTAPPTTTTTTTTVPAPPPTTTTTTTTVPAPPPPPPPKSSGLSPIVAVNPSRVFDSRALGGPRSEGSVTEVAVANRSGVPRDAVGAVLNVTALHATAPGYLSVFPCGTPIPDASNVNYTTGQTVPNTAISRIGTGGRVCVYTSADTGLIVDVTGYLPAASDVTVDTPARFYDTRRVGGPAKAGAITEILIAGRSGAPANPSAVILNVTALEAAAPGYFTVFPCGTAPPDASNLNYTTGQTVPNAVIARVSSIGSVCVFTSATAGLIVDVAGFVPAGSEFTGANPSRMFDSRNSGQRPAGSVTEVQITGRAGIPTNATTVILNVTALEATAPGYLTVFPCGTPVPDASTVNYTTDQTVPNAAIVKIGSGGSICVFTSAMTGLIVDASGHAT